MQLKRRTDWSRSRNKNARIELFRRRMPRLRLMFVLSSIFPHSTSFVIILLFLSSRCFEFFVQFIKWQSKGVTCHDKVINRTAIIIDIRSLKPKILIKFLDYFLNQLEISTQLISFLTFAELQTNLKLNDIKELNLLLV